MYNLTVTSNKPGAQGYMSVITRVYRGCSNETQMFTQPSAPAMQAPSHAISASFGASIPWMSGYAKSWNGGSDADGGNNRGSCVLKMFASVLGEPALRMSDVRLRIYARRTVIEHRRGEILHDRTVREVDSDWNIPNVVCSISIWRSTCIWIYRGRSSMKSGSSAGRWRRGASRGCSRSDLGGHSPVFVEIVYRPQIKFR